MESNYNIEILILNTLFVEMSEALINKPASQDYEANRIYIDNTYKLIFKWVKGVSQVKQQLKEREPITVLTADNRPA